MLTLLPVLLLVGLTAAQEHCCAPRRYEGHEDFMMGFYNHPERPDAVLGYSHVHYDLDGKRLASYHVMHAENSDTRRELFVLDRFDTQRRYMVEKQENGQEVCTISSLDGELRPTCVSESAEHVGERAIGAAGALQLDKWFEAGPHHDLHYYTTRHGCWPFSYEHVHVAHDGETLSYYLHVSNNSYREGIEDDRVFDTPMACRFASHVQSLPLEIETLHERFIQRN